MKTYIKKTQASRLNVKMLSQIHLSADKCLRLTEFMLVGERFLHEKQDADAREM